MDANELDNRFRYHPPNTPERVTAHETVRDLTSELARRMNEILPEGREKAVAMTKLEELGFWSNAAIARQA